MSLEFIMYMVALIAYSRLIFKRLKRHKALCHPDIVYKKAYIFKEIMIVFLLGTLLLFMINIDAELTEEYGDKDTFYWSGPLVILHLQGNDQATFELKKQKMLNLIETVSEMEKTNNINSKYSEIKRASAYLPIFHVGMLRYNVTGSFIMNHNRMVYRLCEQMYFDTHKADNSDTDKLAEELNDKLDYDYNSNLFDKLSFNEVEFNDIFHKTQVGLISQYYENSLRYIYSIKTNNIQKFVVYNCAVDMYHMNNTKSFTNKDFGIITYIDLSKKSVEEVAKQITSVNDVNCVPLAEEEIQSKNIIYYIFILIIMSVAHIFLYYTSDYMYYRIK